MGDCRCTEDYEFEGEKGRSRQGRDGGGCCGLRMSSRER